MHTGDAFEWFVITVLWHVICWEGFEIGRHSCQPKVFTNMKNLEEFEKHSMASGITLPSHGPNLLARNAPLPPGMLIPILVLFLMQL